MAVTMHPDLKALVAACRDPAERTARLVLADWLDEHGDPRTGYAVRWMVRHGKEPHRHSGWRWYRRGIDDTDPRIFAQNRRERRMPIVQSWVPDVVGRELPDVHGRNWFTAVKKLARALARVKEMVDL